MRVEEFLKPSLIRCRIPAPDKLDVLRLLAEAVQEAGGGITLGDIFDATSRKERLVAQAIGNGIALCHLRTEKVEELTIAMGTRPEGIQGFGAPEEQPVKVAAMFLIPRRHSDLYLRVMAALIEALSHGDVLDQVIGAQAPAEVLAAFAPDQGDLEHGEVLALITRQGAVTPRVARMVASMPAAEVADLMEDLSPADRAKCLSAIRPERAAEVTSHMGLIPVAATLRRMAPDLAAQILACVPPPRCADILQRTRPEDQSAILNHLVQRGRREVQTLLKYPPHTAGGIMSPDVLAVPDRATVAEAIAKVASFKDRRQTDVYVVNPENRLLGRCEIHDLLTADAARPVRELMQEKPLFVHPDRDQEELRRLAARNCPRSIPVVGTDDTLLGVVVQDDLLEVIQQEANEDLGLLVGTTFVDPLHTPLGTRIRMRLPWLLLTLAGELTIALVITWVFKPTLDKAVVLVAFMPAILATGGNVGLQSTTMVVRGLGMGTLKQRHAVRMVLREFRLGILLGIGCGAVAGGAAILINWSYPEVLKVALSVALAMTSATMATAFAGTMGPLLLQRMRLDPATACGPFVTMFNDMFGSVVYLFIAMLMNFHSPPAI